MTKTQEQKKLQGTYRKDRNGGLVIPEKIDGIPAAPQRLDETGAKIWGLVCGELYTKNIMYTMDLPQLEIYCKAMQDYWKADDMIEEEGAVYYHTNKAGETNPTQSPWINVKMKSWEIINRLSAKFGMTPIDRNKLDAPKEEPDNPLDKILKR